MEKWSEKLKNIRIKVVKFLNFAAIFFISPFLDREPPIENSTTGTDALALSLPAFLCGAFALAAFRRDSVWFGMIAIIFYLVTILERWLTAWTAKNMNKTTTNK